MLVLNPERSSLMRKLLLITAVGVLMMSFSLGWAGIPHLINYQGMLTDNGGILISEPRDLTFTIYDAPTSGTALWTETHTAVPIEDGLFNVILGGATTPIPDSVFDAPERYLGIKVGTDPELTPRIQLSSVGYAYRARAAEYAEASGTAETDGDWTIDGDDIYSAVSGNVGIGTSSPDKILDVNGHIGLRPGILANAGIWLKTQAGIDDWYMGKTNIGGTNQIGFYKGDWRMVVDSSGYVGIGTTSPDSRLHLKGEQYAYLCFDHSGDKAWYLGSNNLDNQNLQIIEGTTIIGLTRARFKPGGEIHLAPLAGNVGIGSANPTRKLTVDQGDAIIKGGDGWDGSGDEAALYLGDPNHGIRSVYGQGARIWTFDDALSDIRFQGHTGTDYVTVKMNSGNVGIGTTSPAGKLEVVGNYSRLAASTDPGAKEIKLRTDGAAVDIDVNNANLFIKSNTGHTVIQAFSGNVGIGNASPAYKLDVTGDINVSGNIRKGGTAYTHPDYVFEPDYELMSLEDLKKYVSEKKCLPNVISAEEVKKNNGYNMDELLIQMLEKIEEQTLYIFQLEQRIAALESEK